MLTSSDSCYGLQKLLDICGNYSIEWAMKFNRGKSVSCTSGVNSPSTRNVQLFSQQLQWSTQINILDVSLNVTHVKLTAAFYLQKKIQSPKRNEMVAVHLIKLYC